MQNGVNHLGHFLLTYLLWDKLMKSNFFRVINVSSVNHKLPAEPLKSQLSMDLDNFHFEKGGYSAYLAYGRTKLYNVLFTQALAQKIPKGKGLTASLHPGVVRTELLR